VFYVPNGSRANPASMTYRISIRLLWNLPDTVRPTACVCAAASMSKTRIIPWMLTLYQLIEFLQVSRVILLPDEKSIQMTRRKPDGKSYL
jgi:hypothetical protein